MDWGYGDDPLVYGLGELEPFGLEHEVPENGVELLVKLAITSHNILLRADERDAEILREQWGRSDYPVLVLIALYLESNVGDADRLITLLTSRPEVFLWVTTGADAERAVAEHFVEASEDVQKRLRESLLAFLAEEDYPNAHRARGAAQAAGLDVPEPKRDDNLDDGAGMSEGEDRIVFEDIVGQTPNEIVDALEKEFKLSKDDEHDGSAPQGGFVREVADYVGGHPDWVFTVAEYLAEAERWDSPVWRAIIWGTSNAPGGVDPSLRLLMRLAGWPLESAAAEQAGLVRMLFWHGGDEGAARAAVTVLDRVFSEQGGNVLADREAAAVAVEALESLAAFVQNAKIEVDLDALFEHLRRSAELSPVAREAVGKRLWRLYEHNPEWVRDRLLPLFDATESGDPDVAKGLVRGVLSENVRFLQAEIAIPLAEYLATVGLDLDGDQKAWVLFPPEFECERAMSELPMLKRKTATVMVSAVLFARDDPYPDWLGAWLDRTEPVLRAYWASLVGRKLRQNPDAGTHMWPVWMQTYLERRVAGFPVALDACEVRELFEWLVFAPPEDFESAVELLERAPQAAPPDDAFLRRLSESGLPVTHPDASARLITLALQAGVPVRWWQDRLAQIVRTIGPLEPPSWPQLADQLMLSGLATADEIEAWAEPQAPEPQQFEGDEEPGADDTEDDGP
jgi:hypothetical protein